MEKKMNEEVTVSDLDFLKQFAALYEQLHASVHGKAPESTDVEAARLEAVGKIRDFRAEVNELFESTLEEVIK